MRQIQIYIEDTILSDNYNELELFQDETININLSVQNVKDISKVFTEFTQSFTVPASKTNNAIFRHFYENAVEIDTTVYDPRLRRPAYIEINRKFFRNGKIQLEKSNLKNGQVESYTITFYGTIINLKDTFGDDKLADLDYTTVDFDYTGAEVEDRIIDDTTDYDVRYPLISSDRLWSYGDSTSTDISVTGGAIKHTELFPALKVPKIFDLIGLKYSINFTGLFLTDARFNDLFLWYKSTKYNSSFTAKEVIDIVSGNSNYFNVSTDEVNFSNLKLHITSVSNNNTYYIYVERNGTLVANLQGQGTQTFNLNQYFTVGGRIKCYVYAESTMDIESQYQVLILNPQNPNAGGQVGGGNAGQAVSYFSVNNTTSLSVTSDLTANAPDIKVGDFISGILKMFNLTITAESIDTFLIEPLDWWYTKGAVIDVTNYIDTDSIDVSKVPIYKSLNFKYLESKSFNSKEYELRTGKPYGDFNANFDFNGDDFNIEVPFENLVQNKFTGTTIQVGYALDENFNSYIPKPILLYQKPKITTGAGIKFNNGATTNTLTDYIGLSQTAYYNSTEYTLNFAPEISQFYDKVVTNTLYEIYYASYLNNLYNEKNRLVSVKAIFPISVLTNLRLNDRLIIRDKRYIINSINANLTSGEVQLELLHDLREIANDTPLITSSGAGSVVTPVLLINGATTTTVSTTTTGVSFSSTTFASSGYVTVTYPANPIAEFEIITEAGDNVITSDNFNLIDEESNYTVIPVQFLHTLQNGTEEVNYTYILQEP